jgi:23S rRNA pseudouridine2605 synthase
MTKMRIQKALSGAGIGSRRGIEQMVLEGRITVNGAVVTELPCFIDPAVDEVRVDGRIVRKSPPGKIYILLNKPRGVVCTQRDPQGRPRAVDLIPTLRERVYCVGRLDVDSTGIILLTNDGELTQYLTHPRYGVGKTYVVEIDGRLTGEEITALKKGVYLDGKRTASAGVRVLRRNPKRSLLEVKISEGRNREVRRILVRLGHKVRRLKRIAIGPITDKGLKIGHYRPLSLGEVSKLRRAGRQ